ncbi:hypothetical protein C8R47DRAFT_591773 [Mycena vitilis]|nr:hypothetical protein C8R47DRAFT_591773 [Mycena vitilis]
MRRRGETCSRCQACVEKIPARMGRESARLPPRHLASRRLRSGCSLPPRRRGHPAKFWRADRRRARQPRTRPAVLLHVCDDRGTCHARHLRVGGYEGLCGRYGLGMGDMRQCVTRGRSRARIGDFAALAYLRAQSNGTHMSSRRRHSTSARVHDAASCRRYVTDSDCDVRGLVASVCAPSVQAVVVQLFCAAVGAEDVLKPSVPPCTTEAGRSVSEAVAARGHGLGAS